MVGNDRKHPGLSIPYGRTHGRAVRCLFGGVEGKTPLRRENGYTQHGDCEKAVTPEAFRVISKVKAFAMSYNHDDSNGMMDYYDRGFMTITRWASGTSLIRKRSPQHANISTYIKPKICRVFTITARPPDLSRRKILNIIILNGLTHSTIWTAAPERLK